MKFCVKYITPYGEFTGETLSGNPEQYKKLIEMTKSFHEQEVAYQYLENGDFMVINRNILKDSIVFVSVIET